MIEESGGGGSGSSSNTKLSKVESGKNTLIKASSQKLKPVKGLSSLLQITPSQSSQRLPLKPEQNAKARLKVPKKFIVNFPHDRKVKIQEEDGKIAIASEHH